MLGCFAQKNVTVHMFVNRLIRIAVKYIENFFLAEVGKILFVENLVGEKRRERLHIGECRGTRKPVIPLKIFKTNMVLII
jgi:hypothetical protein